MKKIVSVFSTIAVFFWMMPLGGFIKPSQEKAACGGQRPFHMCSMMSQKAAKADGKVSFKNNSSERESKSQRSGADDFFLITDSEKKEENFSKFFKQGLFFYPKDFFHTPSPVPKKPLV